MFPSVSCLRFLRTLSCSSKWVSPCVSVLLIPYHGKLNPFWLEVTCRSCSKGKSVVTQDYFASGDRNKETYLCVLDTFKGRDIHRRGHVEFIYSAMRYMDEFGVNKDLEVYKSLLDVLPKGKFIPQNIFQAEFMHYPKQQQCAIDLLEKMENNGVMPDRETELILLNIFGRRGHPVRKFWRMMYWMPKFQNLSPWPLPKPVPNDSFELAMLAIKRISSVDVQTKIKVYQAEDLPDSLDKTWIICAQSPKQKELIAEHSEKKPIFVEGPFRIWLREAQVHYFIVRSDPCIKSVPEVDEDDVGNLEVPFFSKIKDKVIKVPSVHEQEDSTILAVCATGTSSRDSLLSLIRHLEKDGNPALGRIPILFTLKSPVGDIVIKEE